MHDKGKRNSGMKFIITSLVALVLIFAVRVKIGFYTCEVTEPGDTCGSEGFLYEIGYILNPILTFLALTSIVLLITGIYLFLRSNLRLRRDTNSN